MKDGQVVNFHCELGDWGTAFVKFGSDGYLGATFFGGTPVYAGPRSFQETNKDIFSFCRLALELFIEGKSRKTV